MTNYTLLLTTGSTVDIQGNDDVNEVINSLSKVKWMLTAEGGAVNLSHVVVILPSNENVIDMRKGEDE